MFKAELWDPDAWAELFHQAGAKYVTITAEHHDGYAMWDSDITEWCATKTGPMLDLVGDLGDAVREKGMKYAPSYHRERHSSYFAEEMYVVKSRALPYIAREIEQMPSAAGLYGPFELSDAFIRDYVARWKEIQRKYKPDLPFTISLNDKLDVNSVRKVTLLGMEKEIEWKPEGNGIIIFPPKNVKGEHAWVFKINIEL